jgi:uncharacterized membrane protein (Fun14 family)
MSTASHTGWFDTIKDSLKWHVIEEKFYELQPMLIALALYMGCGFITGFLVKKFSSILAIIITALVIVGILQHLQVISVSVNWFKMHEWFGIKSIPAFDTQSLSLYGDWVKHNVLQVLVFLLGFALGIHLA